MKVLSIGTDKKLFEKESPVRARIIEHGTLFNELHIIVFTLAKQKFVSEKISDNVWIYPTNSLSRFLYPFSARALFKKELSEFAPDVITTQDPFETGLAGWLINRKVHTKLHVQIHTDFLSSYFTHNSFLNIVRVRIARWLLPKADAVRAVSLRVKQSLSAIDPKLPERTVVLPIYSDLSAFKNISKTVDLHKKYPQFSHIILMASRFTPEKNIGLALSVLRDVIVRFQNVGLIIVGEGPEKRYLQGLVLRYHLDRNVVFEPWQQQLAAYYASADIFFTTSLYEGYGLTLLEAAVSGCPIVSSDVGIASTVIEGGKNGFISTKIDKNNFVTLLLSILEKPELYASLKDHAKQYAEQKMAEPKTHYLEAYKHMLESTAIAP